MCSAVFVHCHHVLGGEIAALEAGPPTASTSHQHQRLSELLESYEGAIGIEDLERFLSDHEGGEDRCLCKHNFQGAGANATVIMSPGTSEIHSCRSQPQVGTWVTKRAGG